MSKNKMVRNVFFVLFCLFACVSLGYAESCSSKGQLQYKYTASGCSYSTSTRTCCSNGSWSAWDKPCPVAECKNGETKECGSGKCGQKTCVNGRWSACKPYRICLVLPHLIMTHIALPADIMFGAVLIYGLNP